MTRVPRTLGTPMGERSCLTHEPMTCGLQKQAALGESADLSLAFRLLSVRPHLACALFSQGPPVYPQAQ